MRRRNRAEAFTAKVMKDIEGAYTTLMCALGDRLGLFRDLKAHGPATGDELAVRVGLDGRYTRDWLTALVGAGYLDYDDHTRRFALPPAHAQALAEEGNPAFLGGLHSQFPFLAAGFERVARAFREGNGVPMADYDGRLWEAMERSDRRGCSGNALPEWLMALPEAQGGLTRGAPVAGMGWASGGALIELALAYPAGRFACYDCFRPRVARRMAEAQRKGVSEQVRFHHLDVARYGLPEEYDTILMFDALCEATDPRELLEAARRALRPGGRCIVREHDAPEPLEAARRLEGAMVYGLSVLYYLPASLADMREGDGPGGGTLPEGRLRALAAEAGFSLVRRLPLEDRLNAWYELGP